MQKFLKKILLISLVLSCFSLGIFSFYHYTFNLFFPLKYRPIITKYAQKYNLDPLLISAIIYIESRFYPEAKSERGALGLMQLMPLTAQEAAKKIKLNNYSMEQLFNLDINLELGCFYFSQQKKSFKDNIHLALISYNAGRGNLIRWLKKSKKENKVKTLDGYLYPETKNYLNDIQQVYDFLQLFNRYFKITPIKSC